MSQDRKTHRTEKRLRRRVGGHVAGFVGRMLAEATVIGWGFDTQPHRGSRLAAGGLAQRRVMHDSEVERLNGNGFVEGVGSMGSCGTLPGWKVPG